MTTRRRNPAAMPVMAAKCASCPFGPNGDPELRARVESRCLTEGSQICHHPRLHGRRETHLCRGARDLQIEVYHRLGVLDEPTDDGWARAWARADGRG